MSQLPSDCLNEIFEYLDDDKVNLHSCLLVDRLWCEVAVRILWRSTLNYNNRTYNTLISCLPNESKDILSKDGIIISIPAPKSPTFNYVAFCKVISINQIYDHIDEYIWALFEYQQSIISLQNFSENNIYMKIA